MPAPDQVKEMTGIYNYKKLGSEYLVEAPERTNYLLLSPFLAQQKQMLSTDLLMLLLLKITSFYNDGNKLNELNNEISDRKIQPGDE